MDKASWRRELLHRREDISSTERRRAELEICEAALKLPELKSARTIGLYAALGGEVSLDRLAIRLCLAGKGIALPVADRGNKNLVFRWVGHWRQLQRGCYGIREPLPVCEALSPENLDLLFLPGLGFDRRGFRLGYGAGYYDRFLARLPEKCLAIGTAFAGQVVPLLPTETHDHPVRILLTELEIIRPGLEPPGPKEVPGQ